MSKGTLVPIDRSRLPHLKKKKPPIITTENVTIQPAGGVTAGGDTAFEAEFEIVKS
jgi:hypothetical protein